MSRYDQDPLWIFSNRPEIIRTPLPILVRGFYLSHHARKRMCQRDISAVEVAAALDYGRVSGCTDAPNRVRYECGECETRLPQTDLGAHLVVVCSIDKAVVTVYWKTHFASTKTLGACPRIGWM